MIVGSLTSCMVLLLAPWVLPTLIIKTPALQFICQAILAGCLVQISQFFYFKALANSEAGIVAAYWNMVPALLPIASFLLLRDVLQINEYLGISFLICGSIFFCLLDSSLDTRWQTFALMLVAAVLQVTALLLEDSVFEHMTYLEGFFLNSIGLILMGIAPLALKRARELFLRNATQLKNAMHIFFGIEFLNLCALATSQRAISLGNPSLVAAVETTVPAYTFLLSIAFLKIYPKFGDEESLHHLLIKFFLVAFMALGVFLVAQG